ncbi:MAG: hypothetical protein IJX80_04330 [Clostridia bacterium]|nr:hypothetical protein [Clostridia bacterium]
MNDYKKYINFFKQNENVGTIGIGILITAAFSLWIGWAYSYYLYMLGMPLLIVGFAVFLYGNIGRIQESDLDDQIKKNTDAITFPKTEKRISTRDKNSYELPIEVFEGYIFDNGLYVKRRKNGSYISTRYTVSKMQITNDAFQIKSHTFSFVSDDSEQLDLSIPFDAIEKIALTQTECECLCGKNPIRLQNSFLVITYDGEKTVFLPRANDYYAEKLIEDLNRKIGVK